MDIISRCRSSIWDLKFCPHFYFNQIAFFSLCLHILRLFHCKTGRCKTYLLQFYMFLSCRACFQITTFTCILFTRGFKFHSSSTFGLSRFTYELMTHVNEININTTILMLCSFESFTVLICKPRWHIEYLAKI